MIFREMIHQVTRLKYLRRIATDIALGPDELDVLLSLVVQDAANPAGGVNP
jgi:hypothetical protein